MERAAGIEPACLAWKARALPLSYARADPADLVTLIADRQGKSATFLFFGKLAPKFTKSPLHSIDFERVGFPARE